MGKIVFSKHAVLQMHERNILEKDVLSTILVPDKIIKESIQKFRAVKIAKRGVKDYLLVVIFRRENASKKIITVFLTSKIKKYLY